MYITGLGTAAPSKRYAQTQGWQVVQTVKQFEQLTPRSRAILRKVLHGNNGISTRALVLDSLEEAFDLNPDALHARFVKHAPALATQAAERALKNAAVEPDDIDAVIISTCTGYLCPGLTSYVAERLGLRSDVLPLDLVGQGCVAALPNLRAAQAILTSGQGTRVLSVCVEVCSAAFYLDDDPGVLISACLFGDGAGAAVLTAEPVAGLRQLEWKAAGSTLVPADRELLRFTQRNGMMRNILDPNVPEVAAKPAEEVFNIVFTQATFYHDEITV